MSTQRFLIETCPWGLATRDWRLNRAGGLLPAGLDSSLCPLKPIAPVAGLVETGRFRGQRPRLQLPSRSTRGASSNSQYGREPRERRARRSRPEITAKRGVYEVGRALRARRCEAGPAILRIAGCIVRRFGIESHTVSMHGMHDRRGRKGQEGTMFNNLSGVELFYLVCGVVGGGLSCCAPS